MGFSKNFTTIFGERPESFTVNRAAEYFIFNTICEDKFGT